MKPKYSYSLLLGNLSFGPVFHNRAPLNFGQNNFLCEHGLHNAEHLIPASSSLPSCDNWHLHIYKCSLKWEPIFHLRATEILVIIKHLNP